MIDFKKFNLNRLYYFYLVGCKKSITEAAREVGLDQSGISRQILALEKELGMQLLSRIPDGVTLTRKGEELFLCTEKMLIELNTYDKQREGNHKISGKLRICTTYAIANYILSEHLMEFQKLHPAIYFDILCNDYTVDIIKNDVDVIIRPYDAEAVNIIQEPLFVLQAKLFASKRYIEKNGYPRTANDLSRHKFITSSRASMLPFESKVDWFLKIEGCTSKANCIMETNSVELDYQAARHDIGIISAYENMSIFKNSGLIQVAPEVMGKVSPHYFTYLSQIEGMGKVQALKKFLQSRLKCISSDLM